jgi:hypothetical protein
VIVFLGKSYGLLGEQSDRLFWAKSSTFYGLTDPLFWGKLIDFSHQNDPVQWAK